MQHRVNFFGGKMDGEERLIDSDDLFPVYNIPLYEPKTTPYSRSPHYIESVIPIGTYFLREIWRNDQPSHYKYVYEDSIDKFNELYGS